MAIIIVFILYFITIIAKGFTRLEAIHTFSLIK